MSDPVYFPDEEDCRSSSSTGKFPCMGLSQIVEEVRLTTSGVDTPSVPRKRKYRRAFGMRKSKVPKRASIQFTKPTQKKDIFKSTQVSRCEKSFEGQLSLELPGISSSAAEKLCTNFQKKACLPTFDITVRDDSMKEEEVKVSKLRSNLVIDSSVLNSLFDCTLCAACRSGNMSIWNKGIRSCFAYYLTLRCDFCGSGRDFWTISGKVSSRISIDDRLVTKRNDAVYQTILAGRLIGVGKYGLDIYHSMIGIGLLPRHFADKQKDLLIVAESIADDSMKRASSDLVLKFGKDQLGLVHEIGSFDGAYQKRSNRGAGGHSRYCFGSVISMSLGKILAYDVACNSCPKCTQYANQLEQNKIEKLEYDELVDSHRLTCPAKFSEYASVSLESELAPTIIGQALERGIIFDDLVCDGDAKTFAKVTEHNPYANTIPLHIIQRYECLAHVGKCMKGHLIEHQKDKLKQARASKKFELKYLEKEGMDSQKKRLVHTQFKGQLVRKNVSRGPWGESPEEAIYIDSTSKKVPQVKSHSTDIRFLTNEMCSRITSFYLLAVRQSLGNPDLILQSIRAIPLHLGANEFNSETNHKFCPKVVGSWCLYQNSISHGKTSPKHPKCLSPDSVELVQAVFSKYRYVTEFFVNKIAHAHTSNNNEAAHNILFSMVRKTDAIGLSVMKLGSALAVIRYNEGYRAVLGILERLGVTIHPGIIELLSNLDKNRVEASGKLKETQHKRFATRLKRQRKRTQSIRKFGKGYESGKFSFSNIENPEDEAVDEPIPSEIISEVPVVPTSQADVEKCGICGRGEEDGIIDELNIFVHSELLKWIMCDPCSAWYHYICVGLDENDDYEEDEWRCDKC